MLTVAAYLIQADIIYTLGEYLHRQLVPSVKTVDIEIINIEVTKGTVAQNSTKTPQFIRVTPTTTDINATADLIRQNFSVIEVHRIRLLFAVFSSAMQRNGCRHGVR